jgi:hypothetical protein
MKCMPNRARTHPTPLTFLTNVGIVVLVGYAIYSTGNPLALLALTLLHELPVVMFGAPAAEKPEDPDDDNPSIGFHADIG